MPDYEIIEWNETNSPLNHQYLSNALALKNYSNASNFIRLWALNKFGGIYFDADFELIKRVDFLENIEAFISFESDEIFVNNAISGAVIGHQFIVDCFNVLISKFDGSEDSNLSGPILATDVLRTYGLNENFQQISGSVGKPEDKLKQLRLLEKAIFNHMMKGNPTQESIENLKDIHNQVSDMIKSLGTSANP
jgi:hypothetical protein